MLSRNGGNVIYSVKSNVVTESRSIRTGPSTIFARIATLPAGTEATGNFRMIHSDTLSTDGATRALAGDKWIHILRPVDGWIAEVHLGRVYTIVIETPDMPGVQLPASVHIMGPVALQLLSDTGQVLATYQGTINTDLK